MTNVIAVICVAALTIIIIDVIGVVDVVFPLLLPLLLSVLSLVLSLVLSFVFSLVALGSISTDCRRLYQRLHSHCSQGCRTGRGRRKR